ncbi:MAG: hypothetical protein IPO88_00075 [Nannocystis sp.]|uniref:hypothetical protein n=1 Tax=Nannocystis sp. TaxID=1962667 RepID=UPI0024252CE7|nr:hypothetical protein [Nannocystis sp.]MBK9751898.1 hypothetical protein [Nannocystis sp.]
MSAQTEKNLLPGSIGEVLHYLDPSCLRGEDHLRWPPNTFILAAYVLKQSGAYVNIIEGWPPSLLELELHDAELDNDTTWADWMSDIGKDWRSAYSKQQGVPEEIRRWWKIVVSNSHQEVRGLSSQKSLCAALIHLMAAADEAAEGAGIPASSDSTPDKTFAKQALELLETIASLSTNVVATKASVLPKLHAPLGGLTLRSFSHNLALHVGYEARPSWRIVSRESHASLNLVLAPWPKVVRPKQFSEGQCNLKEMPDGVGVVNYEPEDGDVIEWIKKLIQKAKEFSPRIDGVVMPEMSLSRDKYDLVRREIFEAAPDAFVICGVLEKAPGNNSADNYAIFDASAFGAPQNPIVQHKHHRWKLDRSQIETYGLGSCISPNDIWWENINVKDRGVNFIVLNDEVTLCCLICEDLARQDPVAELVRSVGPSLVIALLMDAPQLNIRWPARYATVLAEDPGSVLNPLQAQEC